MTEAQATELIAAIKGIQFQFTGFTLMYIATVIIFRKGK